MKNQKGFTLIELIVVIVILGILAATALPKFANLSGDARVATLNAARGALQSTSAMAHGSWLVAAVPPATVTYEGSAINMNALSGYPTANQNLANAAGLANDYTVILESAAATANSPATAANQIAIIPRSVAGTTKGLTCFFYYTGATAANTVPVLTAAPVSTNC
jgi:MSHA pilin protein MshA